MKLSKIMQILDAETLYNVQDRLDLNVNMACGSDLMSDVLCFIKSKALLLTGLTTKQVVYTAENSEVDVVCFVRGKKPSNEVIKLAREKNIILMATKHPMFESCGLLYKYGLKGCSDNKDL